MITMTLCFAYSLSQIRSGFLFFQRNKKTTIPVLKFMDLEWYQKIFGALNKAKDILLVNYILIPMDGWCKTGRPEPFKEISGANHGYL
jgi:hypothetical protein